MRSRVKRARMEVGGESDGMGISRRWRVRYDATSNNSREAEGQKGRQGKADQSKVAAAAGLDVLYLQPETRRARGAARVMALVGLCLLSCAAVCCRTVRRELGGSQNEGCRRTSGLCELGWRLAVVMTYTGVVCLRITWLTNVSGP